MPERDKVAVANLRRTHSLWDRARRDYNALVAKSEANENTQGCKFERDLKSIVQQGGPIDQNIQALESKYLCGKDFSDEEIKMGADMANSLVTFIKEEKVLRISTTTTCRMYGLR